MNTGIDHGQYRLRLRCAGPQAARLLRALPDPVGSGLHGRRRGPRQTAAGLHRRLEQTGIRRRLAGQRAHRRAHLADDLSR